MRVVAGVLQRLHEEALVNLRDVGRELAHLIGLSAVCVLEGYGQHLVGLQSALQRDVAQGVVQRVLRRVQQPGTGQLLVVDAAHQLRERLQPSGHEVDAARGGVDVVHQRRVDVVGQIAGHLHAGGAPHRVLHIAVLTQLAEGHNVSGVRGRTALVRHPHLHAVHLDTGSHVGQRLHGAVVYLTKEMRQEEVAVLFIVGNVDLKRVGLRATFRRDALRGRLLLRQHGLQRQLAKLHVGAYAEEARCAVNERIVRGEGDVAGLHQLDNLVFLAVVLQLQVLRVEVERRIGVVVQVHVHLVAHLSVDAQVDFLVEIEGGGVTVADGQRRVVDVLLRHAYLQLGRTLGLHTHTAGTEYLLGRSEVEVHVGERELVLAFRLHVLGVFLTEELLSGTPLAPLHVFGGRHHDGSIQIAVANLRTDVVEAERVVVLHLLLHVVGQPQVEGSGVEVLHHDRSRGLNTPSGMQQRVGDALVLGHRAHLSLGHRASLLCLVILRHRNQRHNAQQDCYRVDYSFHLICFSANFTTCSTGSVGCS